VAASKRADMQGKATFEKSRKETHQRPFGLWRICQWLRLQSSQLQVVSMTSCAACWVSAHTALWVGNVRFTPPRCAGCLLGSWRGSALLRPVSKNNVEGKTTGEPVWEVIGEIKFNQVANHPGACAELSEKIKWPAAQQAMVFDVNRCHCRRLVSGCPMPKL